ncbi:MAG: HPr family phosphocarrier protein [Endomicrobiales bacterium]|nr:HPr family phosphocarrier protein [Endomicrobiales bacterium]
MEKAITIKNKLGLHARPAAILVQTVSAYKSNVKILKDSQEVNGKSIMGIMTLAASCGSEIRLVIDGEDEAEAMNALVKLIDSGFGEK